MGRGDSRAMGPLPGTGVVLVATVVTAEAALGVQPFACVLVVRNCIQVARVGETESSLVGDGKLLVAVLDAEIVCCRGDFGAACATGILVGVVRRSGPGIAGGEIVGCLEVLVPAADMFSRSGYIAAVNEDAVVLRDLHRLATKPAVAADVVDIGSFPRGVARDRAAHGTRIEEASCNLTDIQTDPAAAVAVSGAGEQGLAVSSAVVAVIEVG